MSDPRKELFSGDSELYLEGENALWVVNTRLMHHMEYFLGSPASRIEVIDYRSRSVEAAQRAMLAGMVSEFADIFNEKAWVRVQNGGENITVELHDPQGQADTPLLWLGVLRDEQMPSFDVEWEFIHPISMKEAAFLVLIKAEDD